MDIRPKVFCTKCYESVPYHVQTSIEEASHREVSFSYLETKAFCDICGEQVYVPAINDKNCYERHKAYYDRLEEITNGNGSSKRKRSVFL